MSLFFLSDDVRWIIDSLEAAGHRADIVGGPVRDLIRGVIPNDFDITTSAPPEETKAVFSGERIIETGIKHGTVTLLKSGESYEITTYRIDGEYEDSRHPKSVEFTNRIEDDLARRDFTVNAIAYSEKHGITDPFGGAEDIERRLIRAVGRADDRFCEDALRIIRGIRFASTLGFAVEKETGAAMKRQAHLLGNISRERIFVEWKKLLSGDGALPILAEYSDVVSHFFPEAKIPEGLNTEAWREASDLSRHISLFYDAGAEKYALAMQRMKTDRRTQTIGRAVLSAAKKYGRTLSDIAFMLRDLGEEAAEILLECEAILGFGRLSDKHLIDRVKMEKIPYNISMLELGGADLLELGFEGAEIKDALDFLLEKCIRGEVENRRGQLLKAVMILKD
ncbi:MAG: CCA tRNA nucleotidyltransferase [Clostridia bacterium]|nr:CCA tRNA nucleotidyltransferase [Clostridia bacterium]